MKTLLKSVLTFILEMRSHGHSSMIDKISRNNDVHILVYDKKDKELFTDPKKCITLDELVKFHPYTQLKKPVLIDNHCLIYLLQRLDDELVRLNSRISRKDTRLRALLRELDNIIDE